MIQVGFSMLTYSRANALSARRLKSQGVPSGLHVRRSNAPMPTTPRSLRDRWDSWTMAPPPYISRKVGRRVSSLVHMAAMRTASTTSTPRVWRRVAIDPASGLRSRWGVFFPERRYLAASLSCLSYYPEPGSASSSTSTCSTSWAAAALPFRLAFLNLERLSASMRWYMRCLQARE